MRRSCRLPVLSALALACVATLAGCIVGPDYRGPQAAATLAGCIVGPDYRGPQAAAPLAGGGAGFHRAPADGVSNAPGVADWWAALHDDQLNALIDEAVRNSPDIQIAQARLRQARSALKLNQANGGPKGSASALALRTRSPDISGLLDAAGVNPAASNGAPADTTSHGRGPLTLYDIGFDATWEVDLFGGTRRAVEAASAEAEASEANLDDAHVSLAAEVAQVYVGLRDMQLRYALMRQSAQLQQKMLELSQQRRARGAASDADIDQLRSQLEGTQATLIPIDAQIEQAMDALAVLCGAEPGTLDARLKAGDQPPPLPQLPQTVAIGNPADVLRQRPDIRAAERGLASSSAQIGAKTASFFPKLTLIGDIGFAATDPGHLLRKDSGTWAIAPYLSWDFLDFGRKDATIRQARGAYDEAQAQYRKVVLGALQDAETSLSRYGHQRDNVLSLKKVQALTEHTVGYDEQRYQVGAASLIDRYASQRNALTARQNTIAGEAELVKDFIALQKSLGLGWQGGLPPEKISAQEPSQPTWRLR